MDHQVAADRHQSRQREQAIDQKLVTRDEGWGRGCRRESSLDLPSTDHLPVDDFDAPLGGRSLEPHTTWACFWPAVACRKVTSITTPGQRRPQYRGAGRLTSGSRQRISLVRNSGLSHCTRCDSLHHYSPRDQTVPMPGVERLFATFPLPDRLRQYCKSASCVDIRMPTIRPAPRHVLPAVAGSLACRIASTLGGFPQSA